MNARPPIIDCDVHPHVENIAAIAPEMEPFWRDTARERGITDLVSGSYPPNAPITARTDLRGNRGLKGLQDTVLGRWGADIAILNSLFGVQLPFSEDMSAAFTRALNNHIRAQYLDKDDRLRASIILPMGNPDQAVAELERLADDHRFVQAMMLVMGEMPAGRRQWWPLYQALEQRGLPLALHAGSTYRNPVTSVGWPSWYLEDYTANVYGFQGALASLVTEGVFVKFPGLKVVLVESGVTWLPGFLGRLTKAWKGVRFEVPWLDRSPAELVREHVRLTVQPFDAPEDAETVKRLMDHLRSDELLLWASDWPHAQFEGDAVAPAGFDAAMLDVMRTRNPLATYARLREGVLA